MESERKEFYPCTLKPKMGPNGVHGKNGLFSFFLAPVILKSMDMKQNLGRAYSLLLSRK
jgi:hypothetical protein